VTIRHERASLTSMHELELVDFTQLDFLHSSTMPRSAPGE
jgi:hypothetical protein